LLDGRAVRAVAARVVHRDLQRGRARHAPRLTAAAFVSGSAVADMGVLTVGQNGLDTATVVSLLCGFVPWAASALCCSVSAGMITDGRCV
jgi:hypothetical protein